MADQSIGSASIVGQSSKGHVAIAPTSEHAHPSKYEPCVGDVVEFKDDCGDKSTGIVFKAKWSYYDLLGIVCKGDVWHALDDCSQFEFIGNTDILAGSQTSARYVYDTASAYFSKPATPTFKGSYEERQKQWVEFHGLKVGDKVKVVRTWETNEDGFHFPCQSVKKGLIGTIQSIRKIKNVITLDYNYKNAFPYFALEPVLKS